jgi:hypothetical protein
MCMQTQPPVISRVGVHFIVDADAAPADELIHDALRALQSLDLEAPTTEVAEMYAAALVDALERVGN